MRVYFTDIAAAPCTAFLLFKEPEPVFVNVYGAQESISRNHSYGVWRAGTTSRVVVPRPAKLGIDSWAP